MKFSQIIVKPIITEKTMDLTKIGKFCFYVQKNAPKKEIEKAIKKLYGVDATDVNIIKVHGKTVRKGKFYGQQKDFKKAIITLKKGQKIDGFEIKDVAKEKKEEKSPEKVEIKKSKISEGKNKWKLNQKRNY